MSDEAWRELASCAQIGGDAWFPPKGGTVRDVMAVCRRCPVAEQCLQFALDNDIREGIFGGVAPKARRRMELDSA